MEKVAILRLRHPLPLASGMATAPKDAFPGSIAYSIEYATSRNALPGWPSLSSGFLGQPQPHSNSADRLLGIDLPKGPRGGPVFDVAGRFIRMAVSGNDDINQLVSASQLRKSLGGILGLPVASPAEARVPVDQIYESALRTAVQIIMAH